ncbi:MAG: hypothetical protein BAJALOKI3v1_350012 [Promethearchaeota archaeon]|nr:MAG: hypothetical protein BAJALOKI3v1_350012 [Candidatus Lokiarchaeota archaeon]
MSETETYKRFPAVRCWIHHIMEGNYSPGDKSLYTIFGKVKRVRITATIMDKREILSTQESQGDDLFDEDESSNMRIEFDLDDGTGLIRATLWRVDPEKYEKFSKGDIVDVIGLIRKWKEFVYVSPEIMKTIETPNFILLRDAEIIKKIQDGETAEIPEIGEADVEMDEMTDEIDIDSLFSDDDEEFPSIRDEIISVVKQHSKGGEGISFKDLKDKLGISKEELKNYLRDLEMEMEIYQSEEGIYQIYS